VVKLELFDKEFKGAYVGLRVGNVLSPHLGIWSLEFFRSKDRAGAVIPSGTIFQEEDLYSYLLNQPQTYYKKGEDTYRHGHG